MTEQPGLPDQFKELVTENEKRMKAIQDQIANQLEAQRKAFADLSSPSRRRSRISSNSSAAASSLTTGRLSEGDQRADRAPAESAHGPGGTAVGRPKEGYRGRAACNRREIST